jgi:Ni/Co efflux regulator RcnB
MGGIEDEVAFVWDDDRRHRQDGGSRIRQPSFTDHRKAWRRGVRSPIGRQVANSDRVYRDVRPDIHRGRSEIHGLKVRVCVHESFERRE